MAWLYLSFVMLKLKCLAIEGLRLYKLLLKCLTLTVNVVVHYYAWLAAKQGWRFDSTYDHKDENEEPVPFVFVIGSGRIGFS